MISARLHNAKKVSNRAVICTLLSPVKNSGAALVHRSLCSWSGRLTFAFPKNLSSHPAEHGNFQQSQQISFQVLIVKTNPTTVLQKFFVVICS